MGKSIFTIFCFLALSSLSGCTGSGGGGNNNGDDGNGAKTKEEAFARLSETHRKNFELWKQKVIKSCDSSEAFGLSKNRKLEADGVDGEALLRSNGNSLIFSTNEGFAILTSYNSFSGTGSTKSSESQEVNGKGYTISAETKREGSYCTVYLFGQKVYETYIAESFSIGAHWVSGKQAQSSSATPSVKKLGETGKSEVSQTGLYSLVSESLRPSKESSNLIAKKLGLKPETAAQLFKPSAYASVDSAVRIEGEPTAVWTHRNEGTFIAQTQIMKTFFDGNPRTIPLELRLDIPRFGFGELKNTSDNGNLKIAFDVSIAKKDTTFVYAIKAFENQGLSVFNLNEGLACLEDRAGAYLGGAKDSNQLQPAVDVLFSPCRILYNDIDNASYESGLMKALIAPALAGVVPSPYFQYNGWDQVLSKLALGALEQGKDIRSELDPHLQTKVIDILAFYLEDLKQEIIPSKNLATHKNAVYQMGLIWSLKGHSVSASKISQILRATDNAIDTFPFSSKNLLIELSYQPSANDEKILFAQNIDGTYKAEAIKALGLSKELNYSDFENSIFNQVIQKQVSLKELRDWSTQLSAIKNELKKYSNIGPIKGDLVDLSIKWLKTGENTSQNLELVYSSLDNSIVPFQQSTQDLLRALSKSFQDNKEALDFARALSPEYKQLAIAILNNSTSAEFESWGSVFFNTVLQKRPHLEQLRTWNDMWSAILAFNLREKNRTQGEFGSSNDWNRKNVIQVAVKETWTNNDFIGFETIAEVARAKNTCDHYKGASSLADCAGMKLFNKQTGMFLDPAFGGRYISLGRDFIDYTRILNDDEWTTLKWDLLGEFFGSYGPIWSKCDANVFAQKTAILKSQVNSIARESDQFRKWDLERAIKETIRNCR